MLVVCDLTRSHDDIYDLYSYSSNFCAIAKQAPPLLAINRFVLAATKRPNEVPLCWHTQQCPGGGMKHQTNCAFVAMVLACWRRQGEGCVCVVEVKWCKRCATWATPATVAFV